MNPKLFLPRTSPSPRLSSPTPSRGFEVVPKPRATFIEFRSAPVPRLATPSAALSGSTPRHPSQDDQLHLLLPTAPPTRAVLCRAPIACIPQSSPEFMGPAFADIATPPSPDQSSALFLTHRESTQSPSSVLWAAPRLLPPDSIVGKPVPEASYNFNSVFSVPNKQLINLPSSYPSSVSPASNVTYSPPPPPQFFYSSPPQTTLAPSPPIYSYLPVNSNSPQPQALLSDAKKRWLDNIIEETRTEIYSSRKRSFDSSSDIQECSGRKRSRQNSADSSVFEETTADLVVVGSKKYLLVPVEEESEDSGVSELEQLHGNYTDEESSYASSNADSTEASSPGLKASKRCQSLVGLSSEEVAQRKKEQNRQAAARYRKKQRESAEAGRSDLVFFEKRNKELRAMAVDLEEEIRKYKEAIIKQVAPSGRSVNLPFSS
ncbi:hypothetical protein L596_027638 [Steinernema carpocapsae]|uniref:BZIP domain-containing protein n=1 Tax=Steinernema carpocapsae TaxID=34508 RepID=A0A4U5LW48_STECR|nr:hypothetical protein L596_027638 [Steinernema carpocapsae]